MGRQRFFGNKAHGLISISGGAAYDIVDGEIITIGNKIYEWDVVGDGVTAGRIAVDISGDTSAAEALITLLAIINANKPTPTGVTAEAHPGNADLCLIIADKRGISGNMTFTTTMVTGTSSITGSGNMQYGENGASQIEARGEYIVEAEDVLATEVVIDTGLNTARFYKLQIYASDGTVKVWDGALTLDGNKRLVLDQAGSTDWIAGDIIRWEGWE